MQGIKFHDIPNDSVSVFGSPKFIKFTYLEITLSDKLNITGNPGICRKSAIDLFYLTFAGKKCESLF